MLIPITFTGFDAWTDVDRMQDIQRRYPQAEFGVLFKGAKPVSDPRYKNRFPSKAVIRRLHGKGLNLALHVCGALALDTFTKGFYELHHAIDLAPFRRIQLNGLGSKLPEDSWIEHIGVPVGKELILQQHPDRPLIAKHVEFVTGGTMSVLMDASGGLGIDTPFVPRTVGKLRVGYAGGIRPDNAAAKANGLLEAGAGDFWLDCESGIRTDDRFDLDKVEAILVELENLSLFNDIQSQKV